MAVAQGYGKTATSGSVFAYDVADTRNSYIGEPTVNLAGTDAARTIAMHEPGAYGNAGLIADAPEKGPGWKKITVTNRGNNFRIAQFPYTSLTGGVTYTYSLEVDMGTTSGYYWRIDGSGGYSAITIVNNKVVTTITPSAGSYAIFLNHNTTGVSGINEVIYYRYYQAENKTKATQFTTGTRSATQGLLPLVGNSTLDLSNVSFDANAQMTFDGTDDYLEVTSNLGTLSQYTIEHVSFKGAENRMPISFRSGPIFYQYGDNSWYYTHGGVGGEYYYPKTKTINGWGHWVIVYNGSFVRIYRNGVYEGQQATSGTANWTGGMRIGNYGFGGYPWLGQIAIAKMYNRALSDNEVRQNYLHYKTRFNLS
jgi:hypothetical protein